MMMFTAECLAKRAANPAHFLGLAERIVQAVGRGASRIAAVQMMMACSVRVKAFLAEHAVYTVDTFRAILSIERGQATRQLIFLCLENFGVFGLQMVNIAF